MERAIRRRGTMSSLLSGSIGALWCLAAQSAPLPLDIIGMPAPPFTLLDQYEKRFTLADTHGQVVLIIYADREGSKFSGGWAKAARERYNRTSREHIRILIAANLHGVPSLFRGMVRKRFRSSTPEGEPIRPVLLDWEGAIAERYGFRKKLANVYLVDSSGTLQFVTAGEGGPRELEALFAVIDGILAPAAD